MTLTRKDHEAILRYYRLPIPKTASVVRTKAEAILATKLCHCISSVSSTPSSSTLSKRSRSRSRSSGRSRSRTKENNSRAVAICTNNLFNRNGIVRGAFHCKKRPRVTISTKFTSKIFQRRRGDGITRRRR